MIAEPPRINRIPAGQIWKSFHPCLRTGRRPDVSRRTRVERKTGVHKTGGNDVQFLLHPEKRAEEQRGQSQSDTHSGERRGPAVPGIGKCPKKVIYMDSGQEREQKSKVEVGRNCQFRSATWPTSGYHGLAVCPHFQNGRTRQWVPENLPSAGDGTGSGQKNRNTRAHGYCSSYVLPHSIPVGSSIRRLFLEVLTACFTSSINRSGRLLKSLPGAVPGMLRSVRIFPVQGDYGLP